MLEVKHLKKEYRTKKGAVTKALDDVSLTFPETGMIFILGKSGSGKSTLLNVCGGLDRMDEGEIIIKGKSSNDFSGQDFDSYRNTYVGFVFQEYNILDEFTVEQNIALALELQNKKPDKEVIAKLLEDVDLTDFATRKPNTLSGGQKQRVAIARALVKEPEIIMADEPTGALDSKTGQQVFDTLKKLSKTKLVLIVSHDRDFAEQYGDRIIELKDGQVISDQTRSEVEGEQNVKFYGTDTVCVSSGSNITDADMQNIRNFLTRSGGTAVISTSREKIAQFREDRPEISVGTFENIKEQPTSKQYEPQKLIRSHMPLKHAIKMGASSLKTKPVRLMFTIFLSVVAFILFGLASTLMLFDGDEVRVQSFMDSKINYVSLGKVYYVTYDYGDGDTYTTDRETRFTMEEYEKYAEKYPGAIPVVSYYRSISNLNLSTAARSFYSNSIYGLIPASAKVEVLAGKMPENDDEVAISDFMYAAMTSKDTRFVYGENNTPVEANGYDDILYSATKPVVAKIDDMEFKIVGVFKGAVVPSDYAKMKQAADSGEKLDDGGFSTWTWDEECRNGLYMVAAVTDGNFRAAASNNGGYTDYTKFFNYSADSAYIRVNLDADSDDSGRSQFYYFAKYEGNTLNIYGQNGVQKTSLGTGEAAVSSRVLMNYYYDFLSEIDFVANGGLYNQASNEYSETHPYPNEDDYFGTFVEDSYYYELQNWEYNREAYKQQLISEGKNEGSEEYNQALSQYDAEHPEPDITEYQYEGIDWDRYNAATTAYYDARDAYASAAQAAATTAVHEKYREVVTELQTVAEAQYRAANPEPTREDFDEYSEFQAAHRKWEEDLNNAVYIANPYYKLSRLLWGERPEDQDKIDGIKAAAELIETIGATVTYKMYSDTLSGQPVKIVGYFLEDTDSCCYLGSDLFGTFYKENNDRYNSSESTKYEEPADAFISNILVPYDGSRAAIEALLSVHGKVNADDSGLMIKNAILSQLDMIIEMADTMELAFIIAGAVLALFAFLLMFNFISASISAKKKDIGILRAIGARTVDVFKIFVSEALIIALICFAISTLGTLGLCILLNSLILDGVGVTMTLFVFGPISVLAILGVGLVTALVSTIIPVSIYSRKPPIASIRAL